MPRNIALRQVSPSAALQSRHQQRGAASARVVAPAAGPTVRTEADREHCGERTLGALRPEDAVVRVGRSKSRAERRYAALITINDPRAAIRIRTYRRNLVTGMRCRSRAPTMVAKASAGMDSR